MMKKWIKRSVALICSLLFVVFASCEYVEKGLNFLFPKDSSYSGSSTQSSLSTDDSSSSSENISSSDSSEDSSSSSASSEDSSSSVECKHRYGDWETVVEATCKPGMKERVCKKCGEKEQEEISALTDLYAHTFNSQTLCTTCGHQEFIESEEYIEEMVLPGEYFDSPGFRWTSADGTYGLEIIRIQTGSVQYEDYAVVGYYGTPVDIAIPSSIYEKRILYIHGNYYPGTKHAFKDCKTLKSVIVCEGIRASYHGFKNCVSLERIVFPNSLSSLGSNNFVNCTSLKELVIHKNMIFSSSRLSNASALTTIYYCGNQEEWDLGEVSVPIYNEQGEHVADNPLEIYYYSETQPQEEGNYWHYVGSDPVKW